MIDTLSMVKQAIGDQDVIEHTQRIFNLLNALVFSKKAISLQWFLGNAAIVTGALLLIVMYVMNNRKYKIKEKKNKLIFPKFAYYAYPVLAAATMIFAKKISGNFAVILTFLCFSTAALVYMKWDAWFRKRSNKIPVGWLFLFLIIIFVNLIIFNVFPSLIKVDKYAESLFYTVGDTNSD